MQDGLTVVNSATTFPALSNLLKTEFPDVNYSARLMRRQGVVRYEEKKFNEYNIYNVDNDLIKILAINLIKGDPSAALNNPGTAIISKSYATKYFGKEDPIDKELQLNSDVYVITGVFDDYLANSHLIFDILFSYSTFSSYSRFEESWLWNNFYTYVQLHKGSNSEEVSSLVNKYFDDKQAKLNKDSNVKTEYFLQSIGSINLVPPISGEISVVSDSKQRVNLLLIGSLILFVISILNYGNIVVNNILDKSKEMNLRKVFGANARNLFGQLIIENIFTCLMTITSALFFIWVVFAYQIFDYPIDLQAPQNTDNLIAFIAVYILCFLLVTLLSSIQLIKIIASSFISISGKFAISLRFRKALLGFQLLISFIVCHFAIVTIKQFNHLQNADIAFNTEGIIIVDPPNLTDSIYESKLLTFKNEVIKNPTIDFVTIASSIPGEPIIDYYENSIKSDRVPNGVKEKIYYVYVDEMYFQVFDLKLLAGRYLNLDNTGDEESVVISNKASILLGYDNPEEALGTPFYTKMGSYNIVGVTDDYFHESFKKEVEPIVFLLNTDSWGYFCFKGRVENRESLEYLRAKWNTLVPDSPFDYSYMDDKYYKQYKHEQSLGNSFMFFTILALLMIALGLFGVISLMIKKNLKSMALRKIFGASLTNLTISMFRDLNVLIIAAIVVSIPISTKIVTFWLDSYSSKISLTPEIIILPGVITCLVAFTSILLMVFRGLQNVITIIKKD